MNKLESICPSCGKTDRLLWPEGCNNAWHREGMEEALRKRDQRIRTLEIEANSLDASVSAKQERIAALEAKLAACEWKPITPSYLPKYGDEVGTASAGKIIEVADAYCTPDERFDGWLTSDYTHFRAINPFAARNEAGRG
jgi:hypothetical protein